MSKNHAQQPTTYELVIGLETHVELKTKSKMFCTCSADYFGKTPNTHTCPVCLGMPGGLPVPSKLAIEWCIKIALALGCEINEYSKFDRKNYFYPDLAKGYQISQYDLPFGKNGQIVLKNGKKIGITRVHMEEDTGKLIHETVNGKKVSLIDFNRSGVPLVEIVTEPDFDSAKDVVEYLQKLQQIIRYLDVSNADMEKGNMRLEPNISLRSVRHPEPFDSAQGKLREGSNKDSSPEAQDDDLPPYKVEVKNINSFRFVEKAINFEFKRQSELLDKGETPAQETRGWNENANRTDSQRSKEDAHDYRYFPEPDIPPIQLPPQAVPNLRAQIPELPDEKIKRFEKEYSLSYYDAEILARTREMADYFEEAVKAGKIADINPKQIANTIINKKVDIDEVLPAKLIEDIATSTQVMQVDEEKLKKIIEKVIAENEKAVADYKSSKETVIMFLVGQVMRQFKAKIDAQMVKEKLQEKLKS